MDSLIFVESSRDRDRLIRIAKRIASSYRLFSGPLFQERKRNMVRTATRMVQLTKRSIALLLTRIEGIPGVFVVHTQANPLRDNFLLAHQDGASRVFRESFVGESGLGINVREKDGVAFLGAHVDTSIAKVGVASDFGEVTAEKETQSLWMRKAQ